MKQRKIEKYKLDNFIKKYYPATTYLKKYCKTSGQFFSYPNISYTQTLLQDGTIAISVFDKSKIIRGGKHYNLATISEEIFNLVYSDGISMPKVAIVKDLIWCFEKSVLNGKIFSYKKFIDDYDYRTFIVNNIAML